MNNQQLLNDIKVTAAELSEALTTHSELHAKGAIGDATFCVLAKDLGETLDLNGFHDEAKVVLDGWEEVHPGTLEGIEELHVALNRAAVSL